MFRRSEQNRYPKKHNHVPICHAQVEHDLRASFAVVPTGPIGVLVPAEITCRNKYELANPRNRQRGTGMTI